MMPSPLSKDAIRESSDQLSRCLRRFAGHDEQWLHLEALVERPQTVNAVMFLDIDNFFS